uniref:Uncharacterized protein n=1 Tax=Heterorhabditis bacteriophora TaxID=37862 RepID=A0A1I7WB21_HETBA
MVNLNFCDLALLYRNKVRRKICYYFDIKEFKLGAQLRVNTLLTHLALSLVLINKLVYYLFDSIWYFICFDTIYY